MDERLDTDLRSLVEGARALAESGLVMLSAGNVSVRRGEEMIITPRGGRLEAIDPDACVRVRIADGQIAGGGADPNPSSETPLHLAVYRATDAGAVVHTHAHFATVVSTVVDELPPIHYAMSALGGPVRVAPYLPFGSEELAAAVRDALRDRRAALLRNHGAVAIAETLERAVDLARLIEWLASLYAHARMLGSPALLDAEELERVAERSAALKYDPAGG